MGLALTWRQRELQVVRQWRRAPSLAFLRALASQNSWSDISIVTHACAYLAWYEWGLRPFWAAVYNVFFVFGLDVCAQ